MILNLKLGTYAPLISIIAQVGQAGAAFDTVRLTTNQLKKRQQF
jgi:hypothetical protein